MMKRTFSIAVVGLTVATLASAAANKGTGGGKTYPTSPVMTISAVNAPSGDTGRVRYQYKNDQTFAGDVQCVTVSGNTTWFAAFVTSAFNVGVSAGQWVWGQVIDNGEPATDEIRYTFTADGSEAVNNCETMAASQSETFYVNQGNLDVKNK